MTNRDNKTYEDAIKFLDANPGVHRFGDVAEGLGYTRGTGGRAIGSMMKAIHRRGLHEYWRRVVSDETGEHGCDSPAEGGVG